MAKKKKSLKKKATPKKTKASLKKKITSKKKSTAKKVAVKKTIKKKTSAKKKIGKKRGRKPSVPNRYNSIKSAISGYYRSTIGRAVKHYEMKVMYDWIVQQYGNQSVRYILMNIDVIVDAFWNEYCNLYPVDLNNHSRFFDWYYLKTYLDDEKDYHYPSDVIQLDLSEIGETDSFEFFFDDYINKADEAYRLCKEAGFKTLKGTYPQYYLVSASCDISKKGNVFKYKLIIDGEMPSDEIPLVTTPTAPLTTPAVPVTPVTPIPLVVPSVATPLTPEQAEIELARERLKKEYELKEFKLKGLAELLKQKTITFEEYMEAIKTL